MNSMLRIASALMFCLAVSSTSVFGGNSAANETGPMVDLYAGVCESVSGVVMALGYNGSGYLVDTGDETVPVFGIGPARYWDGMGVAQPQVGESIVVEVCWLAFSDGTEKAIATSIIVGDAEIVLRDSETGQPVWRGYSNGSQLSAHVGGGGQVQASLDCRRIQ